MSFHHGDLESLIFVVSFMLFGSYTISVSSSMGFSKPQGQKFGDVPLRTKYSKVSHTLHNIWLDLFPFVSGGSFYLMAEEGIDL